MKPAQIEIKCGFFAVVVMLLFGDVAVVTIPMDLCCWFRVWSPVKY